MNSRLALFGTAALLSGIAVPAQNDADLILRRDDKLAQQWIKNAPWITGYDQAREASKQTGKPIFAYFTRSYAP